jgi:penicillin amidase
MGVMRKALRLVLLLCALLAILAAGGSWWAYGQLKASLPVLDGERQLPGLDGRVTVERDRLGIPTIKGGSRRDVARATGFLHAQDRFFQMDLMRRRAAGELSALVGAQALVADTRVRRHRLRAEAREAVGLLSTEDRAVLDAYVAGVNAGLAALGAVPFEYTVLRQTPDKWLAEDSLLVVLSMFLTLQDEDGEYESTLATMSEVLPPEMAEFLAPRGTEWDAPVMGSAFEVAKIPGPDVYNLRRIREGKPDVDIAPVPDVAHQRDAAPWSDRDSDVAFGSNNWAVSGRLTPDGGALVANDMHLLIRVPNTWYRARLEWPDAADPASPHVLVGTTLPGVPTLVTGSNTHVAWGFTNTYADWTDLIVLELHPRDSNRYLTPWGWQAFSTFDEVIHVAGQNDQHVQVRWTIWGPVIGKDFKGRLRAAAWVGHAADRLARSIMPLENVRTIEEAFDAANGVGVPGQNLVVADRTGRIGWTVFGAIPFRAGMDGRLPTTWGDGWRGWNGWLDAADYPRIVDPPGGRLWTANARVVDGNMLAKLGDGSYEVGSRASIIRDRLHDRDVFTARDMLEIQLNAEATFLSRWRDLILSHLSPGVIAGDPSRQRFRDVVQERWSGAASPDSPGYLLTRRFRDEVMNRVISFLLSECYDADPAFDYTTVRRREGVVWKLTYERPAHLLNPLYGTWSDLFTSAIDTVTAEAEANGSGDLVSRTWADDNQLTYRHPLSAALPLIGRWLDMPHADMPGDLFTPRMQFGASGASERMVVSPGREAEGIMQMPTGQSGHPLSPYYGNSHTAWVRGEPTPFLPGPAEHTLTLNP